MARYDFTLGRVASTHNLVTNGTFTTDLSGWGQNFQVTWDNGTAKFADGDPLALPRFDAALTQGGVTTPGKYYKLKFDVTSAFEWLVPFINWGKDNAVYAAGTHEIFGYDLGMVGASNFTGTGFIGFVSTGVGGNIDNVECYEMLWNPPLNDIPIGWNDTTFLIERDTSETVDFIIEEFEGSLQFRGDGYAYLYDLFLGDDACVEIPVRVRKDCGNGLEDYVEGVIYLNDVEFDLQKCLAMVDIVDVFAQSIKNGRKEKANLDLGFGVNIFGSGDEIPEDTCEIPPPNSGTKPLPIVADYCHFHDRDGVLQAFGERRSVYLLNEVLRYLILYGSNLNVGYQSTLFEDDQDFGYTLLTTGKGLRYGTDNNAFVPLGIPVILDVSTSFKEVMEEVSKSLNLGWYVTGTNSKAINVVSKDDMYDDTILFTLNNVKDITVRYVDTLYRSVDIGYEFGQLSCVEGFKEDITNYISTNTCTSEEFPLVSKYGNSSQFYFRMVNRIGTLPANIMFEQANGVSGAAVQFVGAEFLSTITEGDTVINTLVGSSTTVERVVDNENLTLEDNIFAAAGVNCRIKNKIKEDSRIFIIQAFRDTDNLIKSKVFADNEYNGDLTPAKNMERWIETLNSDVFKDDRDRLEVVRTTDPKDKIYSFSAPVSDAQLAILRANPLGKIAFTGGEGWVNRFSRNEVSGITEIELLST